MDAVQLHLLFNHIPIIGTGIGLTILFIGIASKNHPVLQTGLYLFAILAVLTVPAYQTGEEAEDPVEELAGISHDTIHEHEEAAEMVTIPMYLLGMASFVAVYIRKRKPVFFRGFAIAIFVYALVVFGLMVNAGRTGGKIRRPDLSHHMQSSISDIENRTLLRYL